MKTQIVYRGCTITRLFPSGMYHALTSQGSVRADTVAGIKEMITEREKPTRTRRLDALQTWIDLYTLDIKENPSAYKASVVADPERHARDVVEGFDDSGIRHMIKGLRAERRTIAKYLTPKPPK